MPKGKQTCKILKEIRKQIAAENDIKLVIEECTYQGDCLGTCPKCEAEVRYLERELEKRQRMGKAAVFAGMSLGTLFAAMSCNNGAHSPEPLAKEPYVPDTTEMTADSLLSDTIPEEPFLLEGDVLASVPDTTMKEEKKTLCKKDELSAIAGDIEDEEWVTEGFVVPETGEIAEEDSLVWEGEFPALWADDEELEVYQIVEQMPKFPGGEEKMMEFVKKNVKYPQKAVEAGAQGRVFVGFVIEKDGSVGDVKLLRGIGYGCDEEAIRVVESMPKWKPGMHRGEPVRVSYQIPVWFKLEDTQE